MKINSLRIITYYNYYRIITYYNYYCRNKSCIGTVNNWESLVKNIFNKFFIKGKISYRKFFFCNVFKTIFILSNFVMTISKMSYYIPFYFLLPRSRKSIFLGGQIFEMEILMDLHVLRSSESEYHIF